MGCSRGSLSHKDISSAAANHGSAHPRLAFGAESPFLIHKRDLLQVSAVAFWAAKFHSVTTANPLKPGSALLVAFLSPSRLCRAIFCAMCITRLRHFSFASAR